MRQSIHHTKGFHSTLSIPIIIVRHVQSNFFPILSALQGPWARSCPLSKKDCLGQRQDEHRVTHSYMLWLSLRMVKEKQHRISAVSAPAVGHRSVQLVSIAFCCWSKQMAQNFSQ